jgi:hypothetical protein
MKQIKGTWNTLSSSSDDDPFEDIKFFKELEDYAKNVCEEKIKNPKKIKGTWNTLSFVSDESIDFAKEFNDSIKNGFVKN